MARVRLVAILFGMCVLAGAIVAMVSAWLAILRMKPGECRPSTPGRLATTSDARPATAGELQVLRDLGVPQHPWFSVKVRTRFRPGWVELRDTEYILDPNGVPGVDALPVSLGASTSVATGFPAPVFRCDWHLSLARAPAPAPAVEKIEGGIYLQSRNCVLPYRIVVSGLIVDSIVCGAGLFAFALLIAAIRYEWRRSRRMCPACGYVLAPGAGGRCSECGAPTGQDFVGPSSA